MLREGDFVLSLRRETIRNIQKLMQNNKNKVQSTYKWKRFSDAPYAAFQSLHREVGIGVLSVAMLASAGLKAQAGTGGKVSAPGLLPANDPAALVAEDTLLVGLDGVEVLGSRVPLTQEQAPRLVTVLTAVDVAAAAAHSINDLLEYAVGVDVRQRGEFGVQTDISVRGGNFDQITLLLNGINISSPHTGHLTADFPVSMHDIERIEVLSGPASRVFGTSAFSGVINIVTRGGGADNGREGAGGRLSLTGGSYGYASGDLSLGWTGAGQSHRLSGGYSRSDGATPNSSFESTRFFYQGRYDVSATTRLSAQAGYSYKPFEANTFYGASNNQQWESNERYMAALRGETVLGRVHLNGSLYWNRWFDHYQWWKNVSPKGENFHKVDTWGGSANAWIDTRLGRTSLGFEARHEGIFSTNLGKPLEESDWKRTQGHDANSDVRYRRHDCRTDLSAFLEHDILLRDWTISLGLLSHMNTGLDTRWRFFPGVDISYRPVQGTTLFASWNMALRLPTFTDLYYTGVNIEGNSDLSPERTNDVSLGMRHRRRGWRAEAQVFYSHKSDMIDWVTFAAANDGVFHSVNFTSDNVGCELSLAFLPREVWHDTPLRKLGVQYAWINEESTYGEETSASKYTMDYLRHKIVLQAESRLYRRLNLALYWRWQDRVGTGNRPYGLLDGRLTWDDNRWSLYAECSNLLDKAYFDYVSIPQPGRWGKIGFSWKF